MCQWIFLMFFGAVSLYGGWAEKTLEKLTIQEKIGQLFMVPACPRYESETLKKVLEEYHIGNVLVKQGHPMDQVPFLNGLQQKALLPLLCAGDAEWGLGMRLEETLSFPQSRVLGMERNRPMIEKVGEWIGSQCKMVGIHLNFAPVLDVNPLAGEGVMKSRSFGSDPLVVGKCGRAIIRGMKRGGVLTCAKHFPGHGEADLDSHDALPLVSLSLKSLNKRSLYPFKEAIGEGVDAIMTAHLMVPALDDKNPATLSPSIVTTLLQEEWGFKGLIITDALNMKALFENCRVGEVSVRALLAGHDILLYGAHRYDDVTAILTVVIPEAYSAILTAYEKGVVSEEIINRHVLKILKVKESLGLHLEREIPLPSDLMERLHPPEAVALIEQLKE